jgi:VRR-NUC domain-containing protein
VGTRTSPEPRRGKALQADIIELARRYGWRVGHFPPISTTRAGKSWWLTPVAADGKGFPDLLLVRDRIVMAEVKGDGDSIRPEQAEWLTAFRLAGVETHVWRPSDWSDGTIESVLRRREPLGVATSTPEASQALRSSLSDAQGVI